MTNQPAQGPDLIDAKTSRTVAEAIGERLRIDARPEQSKLPFQLQLLLDRLRMLDIAPQDIGREGTSRIVPDCRMSGSR
ncbi:MULTISPECIES: hypothetical protein [unclassified Nitrobacter]|uniref:hypothetical protein n=1 Tax=unclassified Nitrobacter TaxID=2620411 RepID=UPI001AC34C85|nr:MULTISPECIES: hypothetical protein [unclassified Nitrobacter]MBN9147749.1 hypothetical protein [Nitrobacter sp.]